MNLLSIYLKNYFYKDLLVLFSTERWNDTNSEKKKDNYTRDAQCSIPELRLSNFFKYILPYFDEFTTTDMNA